MGPWSVSADFAIAITAAAIAIGLSPSSVAAEPRVCHPRGLASKKAVDDERPSAPLGTLVQTHTDERVPLDAESPTSLRFDALLEDHTIGERTAMDPRLLTLLRTLATEHAPAGAPLPTIELVSGFRSPKLNERMRKKGHHVASHSQHSLGHAVDFRLVVPCPGATAVTKTSSKVCPEGSALALDPRTLAREIRETGWDGGTGIYTLTEDWFVHADVGANRTWFEGPQGAETPGQLRAPLR